MEEFNIAAAQNKNKCYLVLKYVAKAVQCVLNAQFTAVYYGSVCILRSVGVVSDIYISQNSLKQHFFC
jgi:hypothetical protein